MAQLVIDIDTKGAYKINELDKQLKSVEYTSKKTTSSLKLVSMAAGAVVGSEVLRSLVKYSDTWTSINSKLKVVSSSTLDLMQSQSRLFDVAEKSRQSYEATATLYARMARATKDLNISQKDLVNVTETVSKALVVSGASAEESKSAMIQLSQAMASGVLRGDEFNSIAENGSRINEMFAKSLGVTIGQLRKMAQEGMITTEVMLKALKDGASDVNSEFDKMNLTIGQAMQSFNNNLGKVIDRANTGTGAMSNLAYSIKWMGEAINEADEFWFGDKKLEAYKKRIELDNEWMQAQKKKMLHLDEEKWKTSALTTILEKKVADEKDEQEWLDSIAWKKQDRLDTEAQLKEEMAAVNDEVKKSSDLVQQNTDIQQKSIDIIKSKTDAVTELAAATSFLYDAQGNLKPDQQSGNHDLAAGNTYSVFTPNVTNPILNNSNNSSSISSSVQDVIYLGDTAKDTADNFDGLNGVLDTFKTSLSSISIGLSNDYYSQAKSALFGSSGSDISFEQAKASAQEAFDLFKTDTTNQDFLNDYNKKMDIVIGSLDEFNDSSKYNSSAEQEFAKQNALRQIKGFQDAQLDAKKGVDLQLEALNKIQQATQSSDSKLSENNTLNSLIKNAIADGNITTEELKSISDESKTKLSGIDDKTAKNANVSREAWGVIKETPKYNTRTASYFDENQKEWITRDYYDFAGVTHTYGKIPTSGKNVGYKQGGYTGNYGVNEEAGVVHGQEYVVNAQSTKALGLNGSDGIFQDISKKLNMLSNLYEINKTTKKELSILRNSYALLEERLI